MEYIAALIDVVPTAANVDYHAKIVRDKAVLRRLVEAATGIIQDVYEGHGTAGLPCTQWLVACHTFDWIVPSSAKVTFQQAR